MNRLSFLRDHHPFLAGAFEHPTTKFLVFKELSPLIDSPTKLHYVAYKDIEPLIPSNPYSKSEQEMLAEFDSRKALPGLIFLGIDESDSSGYTYKNFTGAPYFAIDVTPKEPYEQRAKDVVAKFESAGLGFSQGMRAMHFPPGEGKFSLFEAGAPPRHPPLIV